MRGGRETVERENWYSYISSESPLLHWWNKPEPVCGERKGNRTKTYKYTLTHRQSQTHTLNIQKRKQETELCFIFQCLGFASKITSLPKQSIWMHYTGIGLSLWIHTNISKTLGVCVCVCDRLCVTDSWWFIYCRPVLMTGYWFMASCILMHMNVAVDLEKVPYLHRKILLKRGSEMESWLDPNNRQKPDCHTNIINRFHNIN